MTTVSFSRTLTNTTRVMTNAAQHMTTVHAYMSYFAEDPNIEVPPGADISDAHKADLADAATGLKGL
jgi:hypothetical protein